MKQGTKLILSGTILAAVVYVIAGTFGYAAFSTLPKEEIDACLSSSILACPYHV